MSHLDAIEHAAAVDAVREAADKRLADAEREVKAQITEVLTKLIRTTSHKFLSIPYVTYKGQAVRIGMYPVSEVIVDEVSSGKPLDALMAVMERSDCPLVAELRQVIADRYIYMHADELAEAMQ